ncbi:predicted protein [Verticillium alfalfae VaMs.102]|uniref:Predicted protein n=1 Tax=Verticillium alfalfae (strain VaMs.102 / ATCC MYA-4576 / FGSC 10136) TaxID=526221 RepID=C9SIS9_VERA1|nr:predicted protein [Verticillium alfalfae VaMs.102]EEY18852.1 predicted protein [Verticillium alfalfae VaMs.102]
MWWKDSSMLASWQLDRLSIFRVSAGATISKVAMGFELSFRLRIRSNVPVNLEMELWSAERISRRGRSAMTAMLVMALYLMSSSRSMNRRLKVGGSALFSLLFVMTNFSRLRMLAMSSGRLPIELKLRSSSTRLSSVHKNWGKVSRKLEEMLRLRSDW